MQLLTYVYLKVRIMILFVMSNFNELSGLLENGHMNLMKLRVSGYEY